ncbi:Hypothetical predicted protein [Paramuricea clavata]|uniref:Uncharacterized protein n=1 Tax=Paramuricea clavata TaxID=317549 RepID=A0A7D9LPB5_PARCT|nr:Hypothetical predicted protein [Paramuricea clavata]
MKNSQQWWFGPEFLKKSKDAWPEEKIEIELNSVKCKELKVEARKQESVSTNDQSSSFNYGIWILYDIRSDQGKNALMENSQQMRYAAQKKNVLKKRYPDEIKAFKQNRNLPKSSILTLTPILMDGLLRSNTRLRYAEHLPNRVKYPVILPKKYPVMELIVKYHHEKEGHEMGLNYILNHLRESYIVVHAQEKVKRIMKECTVSAREDSAGNRYNYKWLLYHVFD